MRIVSVCVAALALGGCPGGGGTVTLTVVQAMGVSPPVTGFTSTNGIGNPSSDGLVHFTATSADAILTMVVAGPLSAGQTVDLMTDHNFVSYDLVGTTKAGWSSNGGMLAVDGLNPYRVRFLAVPMIVGSGAAMGTFMFNGSGTFR
jgi:hypothetical protein